MKTLNMNTNCQRKSIFNRIHISGQDIKKPTHIYLIKELPKQNILFIKFIGFLV